jgi:NAD(P)-dependent dehydrogenase (short-subunit alcohol dehydrogenase family)
MMLIFRFVNIRSLCEAPPNIFLLQKGETYEKFLAYAQSKSANLLFCHALAHKLGSKNIRSFGVDPGGIIQICLPSSHI